MRFKLPAEKVAAASQNLIAHILKRREEKKEAVIARKMRRKGLHFDGWRPVWRTRTREEAIASEDYCFNDLSMADMWAWRSYDVAVRLRDGALAVMAETNETGHNRYVELTDEDWHEIGEWADGAA